VSRGGKEYWEVAVVKFLIKEYFMENKTSFFVIMVTSVVNHKNSVITLVVIIYIFENDFIYYVYKIVRKNNDK